MSYRGIADFRSDTVTRPTDEMRKAMYESEVGDDVHGDDPTVNRLEELAAEKLGKEAALFVPSGTMGNTIAMKLGAGEGKVVIMEEKCHIFNFEFGNVSKIAGSLPRVLPSKRGEIPLHLIEEILDSALKEHMPEIKAIALENSHNIWGGTILSQEYIRAAAALAKKHGLHLHLDGARVFNAAVAQTIDVKEIVNHFDSVMFCLSKGLSAPIGSILAGESAFIKEARKVRKSLGGGMRQVGVIAAPGIVALEKMVDRLAEDHVRAKRLAQGATAIKGIEVDADGVDTNMVMIKVTAMAAVQFLERLAERDVWALPVSGDTCRFVVHKDIDDRDIETAVAAIEEVIGG